MKKKIKIIFLVPSLAGGGSEKVLLTLVSNFSRELFEIHLAVANMKNAVYESELPGDIEVVDLEAKRVLFALPKIIALLWKGDYDIAFSTLGHLNLALSIVKPLLPSRTKYIARESSIVSETIKSYTNTKIWKLAYRLFYPRLDAVICQSNYMLDDLKLNFKIPQDKMVVIHNPIDYLKIQMNLKNTPKPLPNSPHNERNEIKLVAAGRLTKVKGFDILISAISLLNNKNYHLKILGDGPLKQDLVDQARNLNVDDQIEFVGFQRNPYPFFAEADAFILSSRHEAFPNVVLEALACGTPVIATPAPGGIKEMLNGVKECRIVDNTSADALKNGISNFSFDNKVSEQTTRPYHLDIIISKYETEILKNASI